MRRLPSIFKAGALAAVAGLAAGTAHAVVQPGADPLETQAYQEAVASRSAERMQMFLQQYPNSPYMGQVFSEIVQHTAQLEVDPDCIDPATGQLIIDPVTGLVPEWCLPAGQIY